MKRIIERTKCIMCGSCAQVCPSRFEMREDGRAGLKGEDIKTAGKEEELTVEKPGCAGKAADVCPVQCIVVED